MKYKRVTLELLSKELGQNDPLVINLHHLTYWIEKDLGIRQALWLHKFANKYKT